jgi:anion-transporting  ArsA/GET3 family ATPase
MTTLPKVIITCGTGGVGKTTISAALAYQLAESKKNTLLITIDPAKRLKTSLKVELNSEAKQIHPHLWALIPESQTSFSHLVESLTADPLLRKTLKNNYLLKTFAQENSGANEYLALEELYRSIENTSYEHIVLDTPPSQHTDSFLKAPQVLSHFFEEKLIRYLIPTSGILGMGLSFGIKKILQSLEFLTGKGFMTELFNFAQAIIQVQDPFITRLKKIDLFLKSPQTGFVIVTQPDQKRFAEIQSFIQRQSSKKYHFLGIILNRCLFLIPQTKNDSLKAETESSELIRQFTRRCDQERDALTWLQAHSQQEQGLPLLAQIPECNRDITGLEDIKKISEFLTFTPPQSL